jgi:predicted TIM-barrel fold metal-dependent hydrolase
MVAGNDEVLSAMRQYPGRILGYAVAFPFDAGTVRQEVRRRLDEGFTGIKLHNINGFPYTDPAYEPAYAMADERRLPVLLHTWAQDHEFEEIRAVSESHPEALFILAHAGTEKEQEYYNIAAERANVVLDPTLSRVPRGLIERMVAAVGADKIVWGSDAVFLDQAHQLGKVLAAKIPDDKKKAILSTNANGILGRIRP